MSTLINSTTFALAFDQIVQVRISAHNSFGWGATSPTPLTTGAKIQTVPSQMSVPFDNATITNKNQIGIEWNSLTGN